MKLDSSTKSEDDTSVHVDVPKGVKKVKEWYFLYQHISDMPQHTSDTPHHIPERSDIISKGVYQWKIVYHEEYSIEQETKVQNCTNSYNF